MTEDLQCFIGLKAIIEKDGKVLVLHDPQMGPDLPGGKVQERETDLIRALQREVREETGLEINVGDVFATWIFTIPISSNHRSAGKKIFTVAYRCQYISGDIQLSHEHDSFIWVDKTTYEPHVEGSNFKQAFIRYFK